MEYRNLPCARLRSAAYDDRTQVLEIEFSNRDVKRYQHVPFSVWRKLIAAPNPGSFFEEDIEEDYVVSAGERRVDASAAKRSLDDLFGS
jgi:hypothetical protein